MLSAQIPENESERLAALHGLNILDTPEEPAFDRIVRIAAAIFNVPSVAISLVDADREWFKARCGIDSRSGDRGVAFCSHTILADDVFVVEDATKDPRFANNPLVTGPQQTRFYAGAPPRARNGLNIGALCLRDRQPRTFGAQERRNLAELAAIAVSEMEHRLVAARAVAATEAKTAFVANMSHEMRTPLTAIIGYAGLLCDNDVSDSQRAEYVQAICRNSEYLLTVVNGVLDLSKIEAGLFDVDASVISPRTLLNEIHAIMAPRAREKNLTLTTALRTRIPAEIHVDVVRLRQILMNLINNAIKFTPQGAVRIEVFYEFGDHPRLRCVISDTGIGMTSSQIDDLFQPIESADDATMQLFRGVGLGLAVSRRLARMLGGDLSVSSEPEIGSAFTLTIPAGAPTNADILEAQPIFEPVRQSQHPSTTKDLRGLQILLAEDGPDNQRVISAMLQRAGADVEVVANGQDAVQRATSDASDAPQFDVVLMDMQMPVMDGYTATRVLRSSGYREPIIALTAHAMSGDEEKCIEAGCDDYCSKPVTPSSLIERIMRFCGKRTPKITDAGVVYS